MKRLSNIFILNIHIPDIKLSEDFRRAVSKAQKVDSSYILLGAILILIDGNNI